MPIHSSPTISDRWATTATEPITMPPQAEMSRTVIIIIRIITIITAIITTAITGKTIMCITAMR